MELGESLQQAAKREIKEETNLDAGMFRTSRAFHCVDVIIPPKQQEKGETYRPLFHYVISQVCMVMKEEDVGKRILKQSSGDQLLGARPGSDVDGLKWVPCEELKLMEKLTDKTPEVVDLAIKLFESDLLDFTAQ